MSEGIYPIVQHHVTQWNCIQSIFSNRKKEKERQPDWADLHRATFHSTF